MFAEEVGEFFLFFFCGIIQRCFAISIHCIHFHTSSDVLFNSFNVSFFRSFSKRTTRIQFVYDIDYGRNKRKYY